MKKGEEACKSFLEPGRVELLEMDNTSLNSVRAAAKTFLAKSDTLNVLVCNAGIMATPYSKTKDGFESQFQTNHLAHFLFFNLLKDAMLKASTSEFNSRTVIVSSVGHTYGGVHFESYDFSDGKEYTPWAGYGQSKTANVYTASHIHTLYGSQGLHGISLDPGGIASGLQKHVSDETKEKWKSIPNVENFMKSPEQGAATSVLAAVGKVYEGKGRLYLVDCAAVEQEASEGKPGYAKWTFDEEKEKRLWEDSLKMVGLA